MSTYPSRQRRYAGTYPPCQRRWRGYRFAVKQDARSATAAQSGETQGEGEGELAWRLSCLYFR